MPRECPAPSGAAAATKAAQAALDAAEKENQRVSVAVVDRDGTPS